MTEELARALVETLYRATPVPPGCRVNHARGFLVNGRFLPSPEAASYSDASVLSGGMQPVLARFSSSSGRPDIAQDERGTNPRGLALRIGVADRLTLVGHSAEAFPARSAQEFLDFLDALARREASPDDEPGARAFPAADRFEAVRGTGPMSFLAEDYHMLHPYMLIRGGRTTAVGRLRVAGCVAENGQVPPWGADYLDRDLERRLVDGNARMLLSFQIAPVGVDVTDVSSPWPDAGPMVELGSIRLDLPVRDQSAQASVVFGPGDLPPGIAFAGDALIDARVLAYRMAAERRTGTPPTR